MGELCPIIEKTQFQITETSPKQKKKIDKANRQAKIDGKKIRKLKRDKRAGYAKLVKYTTLDQTDMAKLFENSSVSDVSTVISE